MVDRALRFGAAMLLGFGLALPAHAADPIPQTEQSDVLTLPAPSPHRVLVTDGVYNHAKDGRIYLVDADTMHMLGMIPAAYYANLAVDPNGKHFYIGETIWTRGNRGTRQDLLSIYDAHTLALTKEIDLPGRALITTKKQDMDIGADGRFVYVYNLAPSNSVILVDTVAEKVAGTIDTPGCGLVFPWGSHGFTSICADGSLLNVDIADPDKPSVSHTPSFFAPDKDAVFEQSPTDRATGKTYFITYSGMVIPATLGATVKLEPAWSIQEAAGLDRATGPESPFVITWRPGGWQIADLHKSDGHLFVLMHYGTFWTHKADGTEVWVLDVATHKLVTRIRLPSPSALVGVTQDANPVLLTANDDGAFMSLDPASGAILQKNGKLGDSLIFTATQGQ